MQKPDTYISNATKSEIFLKYHFHVSNRIKRLCFDVKKTNANPFTEKPSIKTEL